MRPHLAVVLLSAACSSGRPSPAKLLDGAPREQAQLVRGMNQFALGGLAPHEVNLELPRFAVRSKLDGVVKALKSLGLTDVFDESRADLTGIAGKPGELIVSNVIHQAFIEVNEKGTEAAAATAIDVVLTSAPVNPPKPIDFHVDRPFMFLLRDSRTQQLLFVGRVAKPEAPPAPKE